MSIPNLAQPFLMNGKENPNFVLMMQQLITELQRSLNSEGWKPPQLDAATIAQLDTEDSIGAFVFNKTTRKFMGNETGTFKTFTTTS